MQVREIMTKNIEIARSDNTVQQAARIMLSQDVGVLPVSDDKQLVGIITDRDIAVRSSADGRDPKNTPVSDVMTRDLEYCHTEDDLEDTRKLMKESKIRRLVVLDNEERLAGILSIGDIAEMVRDPNFTSDILHSVTTDQQS